MSLHHILQNLSFFVLEQKIYSLCNIFYFVFFALQHMNTWVLLSQAYLKALNLWENLCSDIENYLCLKKENTSRQRKLICHFPILTKQQCQDLVYYLSVKYSGEAHSTKLSLKTYGVYKDGQEIEVKRLSRYLAQGTDEFKNEVIFIAEL